MKQKLRKREYQIIKNATSEDLARMDEDGWRREHTQFRPDGVLDCIFSRVKLEEKPTTPPMKVETVIFPPVGGADVLDARVGLFDIRKADGLVTVNKLKVIPSSPPIAKILEQNQQRLADGRCKIAEVALEAGNEFWEKWQRDNPIVPFSEKVGA